MYIGPKVVVMTTTQTPATTTPPIPDETDTANNDYLTFNDSNRKNTRIRKPQTNRNNAAKEYAKETTASSYTDLIVATTATTALSQHDNRHNKAKLSNHCEFNPCQNKGVCLLVEFQRFTCFCKKFFYGVYCEHSKKSLQ